MATKRLTLSKPTKSCKQYRTRWYDDAGKLKERKFGAVRSEAMDRFDKFRADWESSWFVRNPDAGGPMTVAAGWEKYKTYADGYYRNEKGELTGEAESMRCAFDYVLADFHAMNIDDFGPRTLKAVREMMIGAGVSRKVVNAYTNRIRRVFKWLVSEEMARPETLTGLQALEPIRKGRSKAVERAPVQPVDEQDIEAVVLQLPPTLQSLIRFIQWTGCRPGEACELRLADLDMSGDVWLYKPGQHKTAYRESDGGGILGQEGKTIFIGPNAQAALRPYLGRPLDCAVFSPAVAEAERADAKRRAYQPPDEAEGDYRGWQTYKARLAVVNERRAQQASDPSIAYTTDSLRRVISRACKSGNIAPWSPNQLRHTAATRIAKEHGLVIAKTALGHSKIETTQIYAERDQAEAKAVVGKIG